MKSKQSCKKEWLDSNEVAETMGMCHGTLRYWRSTGQGPRYYRVNRSIRYRAVDVEAWMAEHYKLVEPER